MLHNSGTPPESALYTVNDGQRNTYEYQELSEGNYLLLFSSANFTLFTLLMLHQLFILLHVTTLIGA